MDTPYTAPWGTANSSHELAPGIVRVDTPSHGGYYLTPERVAEMPEPLRNFKPFAGANWYEEDCDWAIVALAFPQHFPEGARAIALATLKTYQPELCERFRAWERACGGIPSI